MYVCASISYHHMYNSYKYILGLTVVFAVLIIAQNIALFVMCRRWADYRPKDTYNNTKWLYCTPYLLCV